MISKMISKIASSFFSYLFLISCLLIGGGSTALAALDDAAGDEQESMLIINSIFDVMLHSPLSNVNNTKPKVYLLAVDDSEIAIVEKWNINNTKGQLVEIPISLIYKAADMYGDTINRNFSLAFGWINETDSLVQLDSINTYLFLMNGSSRFIQAETPTALIASLMHHTPISVGAAMAYEPSEVENVDVATIVSNTASSLGDVLSWFWNNFGIYITIAVLVIAFGIIKWAK